MNFKYENHLYRSISIIYGLIIDPDNDHFLTGLIAQLVEPAPASIAEVRIHDQGPVHA